MLEIELRYVEDVERALVVGMIAIVGDGGFFCACELVVSYV